MVGAWGKVEPGLVSGSFLSKSGKGWQSPGGGASGSSQARLGAEGRPCGWFEQQDQKVGSWLGCGCWVRTLLSPWEDSQFISALGCLWKGCCGHLQKTLCPGVTLQDCVQRESPGAETTCFLMIKLCL